MPDDSSGQYIHGTAPEEQRRLSLLNTLLNRSTLDALRLAGGERVLDVGSGLGQLSRGMARRLGEGGSVVTVERDPEQLAEARRLAAEAGEGDLVEMRRGDAVALPLADEEWGSFDIVHTRFLLEHLPDPDRAVAAMVAAARPGGRIVLEDDDHDLLRLWPEVPGFDRLWQAYVETYEAIGNDPFVGRRLVSMLWAAGALPVRNDLLFFGSCAGQPSFTAWVDNFRGLIEGAPERIVATGSITDAELAAGLEALDRWSRLPDASMWYATCWAEGRRPSESDRARPSPATVTPPAPSPAERTPPPSTEAPGIAPAEAKRSGRAPTPPVAARPARARRKVTSARLLAESAADLNSSLELERVFEKIAERVGQLVDSHLFCVMLWDEEKEILEHSYSLRYGEHQPQSGGFRLGEGLSGSAAQTRKPIRVDDVRSDPRYVRYRHAEVEVRSELTVPLVVRDRLVGVLDIESTEPAAFTPEDEQTIGALASQIATALENARLYREVRTNERRMEHELETARRIQRGLLPGRAPDLAGWEIGAALAPALQLSGDFYDWLPCGSRHLAIALGDVAGKATPAALYGSLAVGLLRGQALEHRHRPAEILEHLNRELWERHIEHRFVAMALVVVELDGGRVAIANAGVPRPYLVRGGRLEVVEATGLPLGGLERSTYREIAVDLAPGDLLVMTSDGLEECRDANGVAFGAEALGATLLAARHLPPREIADRLIAATRSSTAAGAAQDDDRTVVVVRRRDTEAG